LADWVVVVAGFEMAVEQEWGGEGRVVDGELGVGGCSGGWVGWGVGGCSCWGLGVRWVVALEAGLSCLGM
jgi:hypothetical protein